PHAELPWICRLSLPKEPTLRACGSIFVRSGVCLPARHRCTRSSELVDQGPKDRDGHVVGRPQSSGRPDRASGHGHGVLGGPIRSRSSPTTECYVGFGAVLLWVPMIYSRESSRRG